MAGPHGPLHATGGRNHGTGRRHPLTGAHGRRQGAARPRGPHRRLRPREVRGFPQTAHRSGQSRAATAQDGAGDRQVQYRSLPQGTAPAAGRHRSDARRAVRAACRSHRPRGALRPGRQCPALLDGADARPPRPDRRVRRGHTLHPAGRGGKIAPEVLFAADLCGVDRIFAVGGAQAVAAMAYGTESIPHVEKSSARETGTSPAPSSW